MKIKEKLSGELIVQICTDWRLRPYCKKIYCPHYIDCENRDMSYGYCEEAMANYFDAEETEASYLLRRLEEKKDGLITIEAVNNPIVLDKIEFINRLIDYINKKESAEN